MCQYNSECHVKARDSILPLKLSVTEGGLTAETGLKIKNKFAVEWAHFSPYI